MALRLPDRSDVPGASTQTGKAALDRTHHFLQTALAHHFHHFLHLFELIEQAVDLLHRDTGSRRDAALAGGLVDLRFGAFLRRHGDDNSDRAAHHATIHRAYL